MNWLELVPPAAVHAALAVIIALPLSLVVPWPLAAFLSTAVTGIALAAVFADGQEP